MKRLFSFIKGNPVWYKVVLFSSTLFLIRLADAIISFWAPNQIQGYFNNATYMGLIISFQSVVGFIADLIFPHIFKTAKARKMIFWSIIMSGLTSLFLLGAVIRPLVVIFLITMLIWGIYYELTSFAEYQFMGSVVPVDMRTGAWGIMGMFTNLSYFLGPLLAASIFLRNYFVTEIIIILLLIIAMIFLSLTKASHDAPVQIDLREVNPLEELKHWFILTEHVWPAIVISLLLGFIDSTFWTTGAVWTEKLSKISSLGSLFLPLYQLPPIFLGFLIVKWGVYKGKKKLAEEVLILAGIFLAAISLSGSIPWQLAVVFLSSVALSVCYPLLEGVYSDIVERMGKEKKHMIGLTSSTVNLAYVIWPPIAGVITGMVGERMTFSILGVFVVIVSFILLFITPKKLKLPQEEIQNWKD